MNPAHTAIVRITSKNATIIGMRKVARSRMPREIEHPVPKARFHCVRTLSNPTFAPVAEKAKFVCTKYPDGRDDSQLLSV